MCGGEGGGGGGLYAEEFGCLGGCVDADVRMGVDLGGVRMGVL